MAKLNIKSEKKSQSTTGITDLKAQPYSFSSFSDKKEIFLKFNTISENKLYQNDALSVSLFIDQIPFLINPDSELNHKGGMWKEYFNGTLSHNTIRINLKNQSEGFIINKKDNPFEIKLIKSDSKKNISRVEACHNGYNNLGVTHFREITCDVSKNLVLIKDTVKCEKKEFYFIELPFHFHSKIIVKQNNPITFEAADENKNLIYLAIDRKFNTEMLKGQKIPQILGWHNIDNNKYEPSTTVYCTILTNQTISFQTMILIKTHAGI